MKKLACTFAILGLTTLVLAKNGRDFAGVYQLEAKTDLGGDVRVDFALRIHNYSDADVVGAAAVLTGDLYSFEEYWRSGTISLRDRESAIVRGTAILPKAEVDNWDRGVPPRVSIEWTELDGSRQRRNVELHHGMVGGDR